MRTPMTATALVAGLTLVVGSAAAASTPKPSHPPAMSGLVRPGGPPPPVQQVASRPPARATTVTLLTGDKIRLDPKPGGDVNVTSVRSKKGPSGTFVNFKWGGDQYVVPSSAVPYVSSTLDLRLFDVSYLARAKLDDAHSANVPVTVVGSRGAAPSALPGMRITRRAAGSASATVGKATAGQLGQRLVRQWRDSRTGASTTAVGGLPGISKISLAPPSKAPAPPAAPPDAAIQSAAPRTTPNAGLRFHTLTINTIDLTGKPGTAIGFVQNVDDAALGTFFLHFPGRQGPISFSVPEGTYSASFTVLSGPPDDLLSPAALVINPQFTVSRDMTLTLDGRTAKPYQPTLQTPPAGTVTRTDLLNFRRQAAKVGSFDLPINPILEMRLFSFPLTNNVPIFVTPTQPVTKGSFDFVGLTQLVSDEPAAEGGRAYDLLFPSQGSVPASLSDSIPNSTLTTAHSTFYSPQCTDACADSISTWEDIYLPWGFTSFPARAVSPGKHTDYWYSSAPDLGVWEQFYAAADDRVQQGERRKIAPGQAIDEVWGKTTYVPSPMAQYAEPPVARNEDDPSASLFTRLCPACRQDDNALLNLAMFGDPNPLHYAEGDEAGQPTLRFWRNGKLAVSSEASPDGILIPGGFVLPLLHAATDYQLELGWHGTFAGFNTSASSDTTWTFRSSPADTASPPSGEECAPDTARACSFLPLLFVVPDLPVDFNSQAKAGAPFEVAFSVTGQQNAPRPDGVTATVSVSYDDGQTWSDAQDAKSLGNGRFSLTIDHPDLAATSGFVSLRVQAHDAAGNAVDQKTIRAYGLTG